ncbi:hypothetical protein ACWKWN_18380 [Microbacterium trichothecenolyticum]
MNRLRDIEPMWFIAGAFAIAAAGVWFAFALSPGWVGWVLLVGGAGWMSWAVFGERARRRDR